MEKKTGLAREEVLSLVRSSVKRGPSMSKSSVPCLGVLWMVSLVLSVPALASPALTDALKQIFQEHAWDKKEFGPARWVDGGTAYTTVEVSTAFPNSEAKDIARYETEIGKRRVLVSASQLVPAPDKKPLIIEDYAWSGDNQHLLIYTNSKKVWRRNTRGDYWVLDLAGGKLRKLGGDAPESSLMFARFSPDGRSAAYVRANNIYVEDIASASIRPLTSDGSATLINGTSDWVNEEEFDIRSGFRWSPDGQSIAYWQFDTTGVGVFTLVNDNAEEYPVLKQFPYPQVGLACGYLGQKIGWHYGFAAAGAGMVLGLLLYLWGRWRYLPGIGYPSPIFKRMAHRFQSARKIASESSQCFWLCS